MTQAKILAFSGSLREASWNKKILQVALEGAKKAGAQVNILDLRSLDLPLYDGDLEAAQGLPKGAQTLKDLMKSHHGFLIASPEYNGMFSGALKNAIDWASRPAEGEASLACFKNKVAGIMAASPGKLGGIRGLPSLRLLLSGLGTHVVPSQLAVGSVAQLFNEAGEINDEGMQTALADLGKQVTQLALRLSSTDGLSLTD